MYNFFPTAMNVPSVPNFIAVQPQYYGNNTTLPTTVSDDVPYSEAEDRLILTRFPTTGKISDLNLYNLFLQLSHELHRPFVSVQCRWQALHLRKVAMESGISASRNRSLGTTTANCVASNTSRGPSSAESGTSTVPVNHKPNESAVDLNGLLSQSGLLNKHCNQSVFPCAAQTETRITPLPSIPNISKVQPLPLSFPVLPTTLADSSTTATAAMAPTVRSATGQVSVQPTQPVAVRSSAVVFGKTVAQNTLNTNSNRNKAVASKSYRQEKRLLYAGMFTVAEDQQIVTAVPLLHYRMLTSDDRDLRFAQLGRELKRPTTVVFQRWVQLLKVALAAQERPKDNAGALNVVTNVSSNYTSSAVNNVAPAVSPPGVSRLPSIVDVTHSAAIQLNQSTITNRSNNTSATTSTCTNDSIGSGQSVSNARTIAKDNDCIDDSSSSGSIDHKGTIAKDNVTTSVPTACKEVENYPTTQHAPQPADQMSMTEQDVISQSIASYEAETDKEALTSSTNSPATSSTSSTDVVKNKLSVCLGTSDSAPLSTELSTVEASMKSPATENTTFAASIAPRSHLSFTGVSNNCSNMSDVAYTAAEDARIVEVVTSALNRGLSKKEAWEQLAAELARDIPCLQSQWLKIFKTNRSMNHAPASDSSVMPLTPNSSLFAEQKGTGVLARSPLQSVSGGTQNRAVMFPSRDNLHDAYVDSECGEYW